MSQAALPTPIVDSHCHLDFPDFEGEHDALIDRARAAGVAPSTVSLVLNGRGRDVKIAPATIDSGLITVSSAWAMRCQSSGA